MIAAGQIQHLRKRWKEMAPPWIARVCRASCWRERSRRRDAACAGGLELQAGSGCGSMRAKWLAGPSVDYQHLSLHGAGAEPVQGLLAGLGGRCLAGCFACGLSATDTTLGSNVGEAGVV
jgi:hypothetical protein